MFYFNLFITFYFRNFSTVLLKNQITWFEKSNYIETELLPKAKSVLEPENREAWEAFEFLESLAKFNKNSQNQFCTDLSGDLSAD